MAEWRRVQTKFWSDAEMFDLSPEDKLFYLCLLTNPKTTACGAYEVHPKELALYTGYNIETLETLIERFEAYGKIRYNRDTRELLIHGWLRYNPPNSVKIEALITKELSHLKTPEYIEYIRQELSHIGDNRLDEGELNTPDGESIRYITTKTLKPSRVPSHARLRAYIFARDNFTCRRCGARPIDIPSQYDGKQTLRCASGTWLELDRIVPGVSDGRYAAENLQTLCASCNARKSNTEDKVFSSVSAASDTLLKKSPVDVDVDVDVDKSQNLLVRSANERTIELPEPSLNEHEEETDMGRFAKLTAIKGEAGRYKYPKEFEDFWDKYPRHFAKAVAYTAWRAAVNSESVTPEDLVICAENYALYCKQRGTAEEYIMHPATFCAASKRRWDDFRVPSKPPATTKGQQSHLASENVNLVGERRKDVLEAWERRLKRAQS